MANKSKFLITGAGGFIGGWLAETMFLGQDTAVRAGVHNWSGAARLARFPMDITPCDLFKPDQLSTALAGITCVIHCAKGADDSIVQGTRNMLEASMKQGIERFIYVSTTEVYGNPSGSIDEMSPCPKTGNSYGDSKFEAEQLCWEYHAQGLPVTVIRPPIVYGPFSKTWTVDIAFKLQSGNWGIFKDRGDGICNLIYISDLVSGILSAVRSERAAGEVFNLNGPETPTWNQYFQRFNKALGLPSLNVIEPGEARLRTAVLEPVRKLAKFAKDNYEAPIQRVAAAFGLAKKILKQAEKTMKTSPRATELALYNRNAFYSAQKAENMLGFKPIYSLDTGLDLSVRWMEQIGLTKS